MNRAAHRRVEQGHRDAAMNRADRVVVLRAGLELEDRMPELDLGAAKAHQLGDRRRRQLAREDRSNRVEARELHRQEP